MAAYARYLDQSPSLETAKLSRNGVGKRKNAMLRKTRPNLSMMRARILVSILGVTASAATRLAVQKL
jgi:hypothetical protein